VRFSVKFQSTVGGALGSVAVAVMVGEVPAELLNTTVDEQPVNGENVAPGSDDVHVRNWHSVERWAPSGSASGGASARGRNT
jgi:hypothetical protein